MKQKKNGIQVGYKQLARNRDFFNVGSTYRLFSQIEIQNIQLDFQFNGPLLRVTKLVSNRYVDTNAQTSSEV